jgi:hypothetical protein
MIFFQKLIAVTSCSAEVEDVNETRHSVQAWRREHMPSSVLSDCNFRAHALATRSQALATKAATSADSEDWL